jgi:hypothetical protein
MYQIRRMIGASATPPAPLENATRDIEANRERNPQFSVSRMSKQTMPEKRAAKAPGMVTWMPSGPVPVITGEQWSEFIRLLTPDEQQAFMLDIYKIINRYCQRIGGE